MLLARPYLVLPVVEEKDGMVDPLRTITAALWLPVVMGGLPAPACESWCNVYSRDNVLCSLCDCDNMIMKADATGEGKPTPHCAGPDDVAPSNKKPPPPPSPPPPPPEELARAKAGEDSGCASFCNKYTLSLIHI